MCCPPWAVQELWPHVSEYLDRAVQHTGGWTLDSIQAAVLDQSMLLWVVNGDFGVIAAVVTRLTENKKGEKICDIIACGGRKLHSWRHLMPEVERYAKEEGCAILSFGGRRGWGRIFPDFSEAVTIYEKRI